MTPEKSDPSSDKKHIVVVGAGFVGLSTALYLLKDGYRVTIVDREGPGSGASFGNASVFAVDAVAPVAMPGILSKVPKMMTDPLSPLAVRWSYLPKLAPWLLQFIAASSPKRVEAITASLALLMKGSLEAYEALLSKEAAAKHIIKRGWIGAYTTKEGLAGAKSYHDLQRRHGCQLEVLSPEELFQLEPALNRDLAGGVLYPNTSHCIEPYGFCQLLAESAFAQGATLELAEAKGVEREGQLVTALITDKGKIACDGLVVAAGAWSGPLSKAIGAPTPLDTERGYHLTIQDPGVSLSRPVYSTQYGFAMTPLEQGFRLAGTVELGGLNAAPNWKRAEQLVARAKLFLPDLDDSKRERWMGYRPSMPDSLPVISVSPEMKNAWMGYGHGHVGLTLGARTGALISDLVAGRDSGLDMSAYSASRFS
ncbi:NAD(P)/FAD-dependent oxidoreductase [Rhodovibrionaceae bacterium A322]